jgi:hypothetical protein
LAEHLLADIFAAVERAVEDEVDDLVPGRFRQLRGSSVPAVDERYVHRVVEQHVDTPEPRGGFSGHAPNLRHLTYVDGLKMPAIDLARYLLAALGVDVGDDHRRTRRCKSLSAGSADAGRGTSDDRDLACEERHRRAQGRASSPPPHVDSSRLELLVGCLPVGVARVLAVGLERRHREELRFLLELGEIVIGI